MFILIHDAVEKRSRLRSSFIHRVLGLQRPQLTAVRGYVDISQTFVQNVLTLDSVVDEYVTRQRYTILFIFDGFTPHLFSFVCVFFWGGWTFGPSLWLLVRLFCCFYVLATMSPLMQYVNFRPKVNTELLLRRIPWIRILKSDRNKNAAENSIHGCSSSLRSIYGTLTRFTCQLIRQKSHLR